MRVSSRINDGVMERLIACLGENHTEKELGEILLKLYLDAGCTGFSFEPITALASRLVVGNLSDKHGRKIIIAAGALISLAGCTFHKMHTRFRADSIGRFRCPRLRLPHFG